MDAVKFQKELTRLCRSYVDCADGCPFHMNGCLTRAEEAEGLAEKRVEIVEKWIKEHPLVTNGDKVMEIIKDVGVPVTARGSGFGREVPVNTVHIAVSEDWWDAEYKGV